MNNLSYFVMVIMVFLVGLAFMSGLWIAIGVNPEGEITNAFAEAVNSIIPGSEIIMWLIPIIALIISIFGAHYMGGSLGLLSVGIALIGGILFLEYTTLAIITASVAVIIGFIVSSKNE